ncbi:uncharacterized protein [Clytia hemisphaerica]|uniref:uncharacterized protein n=1 Tax=Clytia hemisphaerica TaxID=252671 RepID=UPI0034D46A97
MLLDKLMIEFEEHFKRRLLSIADGTFDGIYSQRFKGRKSYKSIVTEYHFDSEKSLRKLGPNLFQVESKTTDGLFYTVDMIIGICECKAGLDGSPCWHQYLLWSKGISTSSNFLPRFDKFERQKFAEIAFGKSLESSYYNPLHISIMAEDIEDTSENLQRQMQEEESGSIDEVNRINVDNTGEKLKEEASSALDNFFTFVKEEIETENTEFNSAIVKFVKRFESFSTSQKVSALHSFGSTFSARRRTKIKVGPAAVSRRKSHIGSRQKQSTVATKSLPQRRVSVKRKHSMKTTIDLNVPSAKKGGGEPMKSNTKTFTKKKPKKD